MQTTQKPFKQLDPNTFKDTNPFISLVHNQKIVEVPQFTLESGIKIKNVPIAYKSWGKLNQRGDNVLVLCHALTGSSDVSDWWGPLLGAGLAFDPTKFFIICLNSMGSPYGSFSPLTINSKTGKPYGPEFPLCTVRDDVLIHKLVLDNLGVQKISCVIGGSMGGMLTLEYASIFGSDYVKSFVALATSARHSAWCISWSEAQRQSIYSDPKYLDGYYSLNDPPSAGLSAARMSALLTYRSRNSFEERFARRTPTKENLLKSKSILLSDDTSAKELTGTGESKGAHNDEENSNVLEQKNLEIHNDGHRRGSRRSSNNTGLLGTTNSETSSNSSITSDNEDTSSIKSASSSSSVITSADKSKIIKPAQTFFSAQSYLRYQGEKFVKRFDANCYISITRKLDTHDLARDREEDIEDIRDVLKSDTQPCLIIGIESDGLFTYSEQEFLAKYLPNSTLEKIDSPEGHDAFLLEFKRINILIRDFLRTNCPQIVSSKGVEWNEEIHMVKNSVFGEAEEVTNW
ncbi:probable Homoserine O-acetyltransferase [Saccharomycodes ludwigii]|uniref:Probable Homoserine O-acetyltransferase n=1 Tax=Saccharomycodes ludwigii TaxID=36035 RepID=A0A376B5P5_9ASCO|nr:hypothetical protein SCDLUD_003875 [Saccharomycodes ludwigii]KAH3899595.1 hypothetical protein SCDLUD_003875 [Saccharomycodes ludwigii]SSD59450.1 probable Homoserine O-acetyltransferase [Saccharomycodes ludwigii]